MINQKGFAGVLVVGIIVAALAGLGLSIYVVKQRTNVAPRAEEPANASPNSVGTRNIAGVPIPVQLPEIPIPNLSFLTGQSSPKNEPAATPAPAATQIPISSVTHISQGTRAENPSPVSTAAPAGTTITANPTSAPLENPIVIVNPTTNPTTNLNLIGGDSNDEFAHPVLYRLSRDPNFFDLISTDDGGGFGGDSEKTVSLYLEGNSGKKYVYLQFFNEGLWQPETPIVAEIDLNVPTSEQVCRPSEISANCSSTLDLGTDQYGCHYKICTQVALSETSQGGFCSGEDRTATCPMGLSNCQIQPVCGTSCPSSRPLLCYNNSSPNQRLCCSR